MRNIGPLLLLLIIAIGVIILTGINNQEKNYTTKINCEELKDCILLDISCLNERTDNELFMFKWGFDQKVTLSKQRKYYINNCLYLE